MSALSANDVPFTQYLRPHGRPRAVWIERAPDIAALAAQIRERGYHFDIEELMDGTVSMTIEPNEPETYDDDNPIASELCPNGPVVPETVDKLIRSAAHVLGLSYTVPV